MGQKVHPVGFRLGITKEWSSRWYANSQTFPIYVEQDHRVREFLRKKLDAHGPPLIQTVRGVGYALRPPRT